jgi:hypothetical protein
VWFVEFAGVDLPPPPGPPAPPPGLFPGDGPEKAAPRQPNVERIEQRFNANTGQVFSTGGAP